MALDAEVVLGPGECLAFDEFAAHTIAVAWNASDGETVFWEAHLARASPARSRPSSTRWGRPGRSAARNGERGPFRLFVPGDQRGGRQTDGVVRIEVRSIDEPTA